jgi:small conductance mechanosensitive channel
MSSSNKYSRLATYSALLILLLIVVGALMYYSLYVFHVIPLSLSLVTKVAVTLIVGYFVIMLLGREISALSTRLLGPRRGYALSWVYRLTAFVILGLVVLAIAGVSGTDLLAGGTFSGLVLGLASQTVLSNIIGGFMIILARPYEIDDRITMVTWQYGLMAPAYPPKFYSQDFLMPGYSGKVVGIGLAYTELVMDDGPKIRVPNSVMVVAAIVSHKLTERLVRTKYEVPSSILPEKLVGTLEVRLRENEWISQRDSLTILINSASISSYVISIDAICKGSLEEPARSSILRQVIETVRELGNEAALQSPSHQGDR